MQTDKLFTGQRAMASLGIYYYNARFYSPKLGRFLSADTIVPNPYNPQDLNRYSYVSNSPLNYTDPSGHIRVDNEFGGGSLCSRSSAKCNSPLQPPDNGVDMCKASKCPGKRKAWVPPVVPMVRGGGLDFGNGHPGVDLNPDSTANPNPEVVASSYGMVYSSTACTIDPCTGDSIFTSDGYGNVVIIGYDYDYLPQATQALIPNGATLFMLYAHLDESSNLREGELVEPGQFIGNVGNTGNSDGTHLHFEIRIEGDEPLPFGDLHISEGPDTGFTEVHFTWHNLINELDPHDFFDIE